MIVAAFRRICSGYALCSSASSRSISRACVSVSEILRSAPFSRSPCLTLVRCPTTAYSPLILRPSSVVLIAFQVGTFIVRSLPLRAYKTFGWQQFGRSAFYFHQRSSDKSALEAIPSRRTVRGIARFIASLCPRGPKCPGDRPHCTSSPGSRQRQGHRCGIDAPRMQ